MGLNVIIHQPAYECNTNGDEEEMDQQPTQHASRLSSFQHDEMGETKGTQHG